MVRPLRYVPHIAFLVFLGGAVVFALATRFPDSELLERAEGWPLVGPTVERFRAVWLPAERGRPEAAARVGAEPAPGETAEPEVEVAVIQVIDPDLVGPKPKVWARPGTPILAAPDPGAREVARVEHLFPLSRLERRGDWFRVRYGTRLSGFHKGWVYLPGYREPSAEEINAPDPVLPLAPVGIDPEAEAAARRRMGEPVTDGRCGPYRLLTDLDAAATLALCEPVGTAVEAAHRRRYGLEPVGVTAETILLFEDETAFRAFRDEVSAALRGDAFAAPARGFVAVPSGGRPAGVVESNLIHELAHLLNRRSLGPALPPWLDEGIARDLDTVGVADPVPVRPPRHGPPVESLEHLFDLDQTVFQMRADRNYRAAGRWIGYLLDAPDPTLAEGFRGFLRAVASGEPIRAELLLGHLGRDWAELEAGFRAWESGAALAVAD